MEENGSRRPTFEPSGRRRCDAWPASPMIASAATRARRRAVGYPLELGVRRHAPQAKEGEGPYHLKNPR